MIEYDNFKYMQYTIWNIFTKLISKEWDFIAVNYKDRRKKYNDFSL